ncbi:glycyl-tRNA synthetase [Entomoplasma freundtii]|uniref:Glycine--tRNA ligase n=1 Tax=Entomoplasma freundtii TaxID=74700 RepID=A0A2K8NRH7_9MOLU|nr:glycine--tRNA ligase [Entomoplasma freundtii]ATZ16384.1 glycyl-tRNA synthetase [Entomoplasma freundtii]TDY56577.1 glycyl-tRNA synthetase [Entomoplasma freundtii]
MTKNIDELVAHLKDMGFVFQGSEIYGGLANSWDYGPLGVAIKNNLKQLWWSYFVSKNPLNVGIDSSIILNTNVWKSSGHLSGFNDLLIECKTCHSRYRVDKLIEAFDPSFAWAKLSIPELADYIKSQKLPCPNCGSHNFSEIRQFTLMFKTNQGVIESEKSTVYLRPETAQGIFINFKNVQRSQRKKLPFGVGQIGKAFRNEITPGNFIFRTREFEQMELEFFYNPEDEKDWFVYWMNQVETFLAQRVGLNPKNYRLHEIPKDDLAHYSKRTIDFEYHFPFGWEELWGLAHRGVFDLTAHQNGSGADLTYLEPTKNQKILAEVIEPSVGVERLLLAIFCEAFTKEKLANGEERIVMKLPTKLAPYQVAVLPLQKQQKLAASELFETLLTNFNATYDETGNIGKRYRRQDAIGTPLIVTYDFDSAVDHQVTVRHRDTMSQERVAISELDTYLRKYL